MARIHTKVGDIFRANINSTGSRYFQFISRDMTQLNSDVIRAFKGVFSQVDTLSINEIVSLEADFYAHCVVRLGAKMDLWEKIGSSSDVGTIDHVVFRNTNDYGSRVGEDPIKVSSNWHVWRIDGEFRRVGVLKGQDRYSYVGLVFSPDGIIELLRGNKYPINYPGFE